MNGYPLKVELTRGLATRANMPLVAICRGARKGCARTRQTDCPDCYVVEANDPRSTGEILRDMERGDA